MISKKTALITGASAGIGREIAIQLAKSGISVCINYSKSGNDAKKAMEFIEKEGGKAITFKADVTKEEDVKKMFQFLASEFGRLDILINNAGIVTHSLIESYEYKEWKNIVGVNLFGKFLCTKHAVPLLKKSNAPKIINIASRLAIKPIEESSAYCCASSAIVMLTKVSALELSKYGIKVNTISPGLTRTPMSERIWAEKDFEDYAKNNPSKRLGKPSDIADAVLFLVSDKAEFINGENINVSGGGLLR